MKELSLNILDIAENSVKAKATVVKILIDETENEKENTLKITISDNGCGMTEEVLKNVTDPFYTTRTTRKVGLGLPFLKLAAEQTGGNLKIVSKSKKEEKTNHGTTVTACFNKNHIDFTPLGDIVSTVVTLIQGHPETDFIFIHTKNKKESAVLKTEELRKILGKDIPLNSFEVITWIKDFLTESYKEAVDKQ